MNDERMNTRSGVGLGKAFADGMTMLVVAAFVIGGAAMAVIGGLVWFAVWLFR